jgi:hypothetical protein
MSDDGKKSRKRSGLHELKWTDEIPPKPPGKYLYAMQADQLREKPGQWALVAQCPSKVAANGAGFARKKKWGPEFEIAIRGQDVYARYTDDSDNNEVKVKTHRAAAKRSKRKRQILA